MFNLLCIAFQHDHAFKAYAKARDYISCAEILEMQKHYKEAISLLIDKNCRLEAIEKLTEYRSNGIVLDTFPSASQIAEQSVECYVSDTHKLKSILQHVTSKAKCIAFYKKCRCYQEASELLVQQGKLNLAFRLLKAQQMYDHGIKKTSELKLWRESKIFKIQKAISNGCTNRDEIQGLLNEQDCDIQGKACYLLGLKCKDIQLSRKAFKCYFNVGNVCGIGECFNLYASLCQSHDEEFFIMLVQACSSVQKAHSCIASKNKTPAEGRILTVMEHFYQLESSSNVYYFPKGQDVFQVHFEDLSDNCDSDGMLELQMDAALSKIDEHLASMRSSWMSAFKGHVLSKLSEYEFHSDLIGCGYLSHAYNLNAPQLKRYVELCCLALEIDPTLKNVLINFYSPNVSICLPFSWEYMKTMRLSYCAVDALCAEAKNILTKPDLTPDNWLLGTRLLCIAGKGTDCSKNIQNLSIEEKQYFDLWIEHFNMMGQECRVTDAISLVLQKFFSEKFVKDGDSSFIGNTLSVAIVHSTALMAMWNSISSNKKGMPVPSIFEQHVRIFDALRPYHDSKCLFKACEEEINTQCQRTQSLKEKIIKLLWHYLDMMVGFNLYKQFRILDRTVQLKDCIIKGEAKICLVLALTLVANLSLIEYISPNVVEYWKAIYCQILPLLSCDTKLLSDSVCVFGSATSITQVYNVLATLIDSFNVKPSGLFQLKLSSQTLLQHSEYPQRQLIIVSDQPLLSQQCVFPLDKATSVRDVSSSQTPNEVLHLFNIKKLSESENQETDTKDVPSPETMNIPPLLQDNAASNSDLSTPLQSATEAASTNDIPRSSALTINCPLLLDNMQPDPLNSNQISEPEDKIVSISPILPESSDPSVRLDMRLLIHNPTPLLQQLKPVVNPELEDDPFVNEAFCGICGVSITSEATMDASLTESKYREEHIRSSQHSERRNQHQLFLENKDDKIYVELKEKVRLQDVSKEENVYNAAILDAESAIKDYEQILARTEQTYDWTEGEKELRKITKTMREMMNGNLQEVQQDTDLRIDVDQHNVDEEVDTEDRIEIPGTNVRMKRHKKTGKIKKKQAKT